MHYVRVYADTVGESHFEDVAIEVAPGAVAPSTPSLCLSAFAPASHYGFLSAPPGWHRRWRTNAHRELFVYLAGEVESQVSDGEVRRFGPGSVVLAEDLTGKGHASHVVGTSGALLVIVQLSDDE
jgi:hypothetical protein